MPNDTNDFRKNSSSEVTIAIPLTTRIQALAFQRSNQRERAAHLDNVEEFDYMKEEFGYRLADRVLDIKVGFMRVQNGITKIVILTGKGG